MTLRRTIVLGLAAGLALVGCSDDGGGLDVDALSAQEIVDEATEAARSESSVKASGATVDDGGTPMDLDLSISPDGTTGTMTVEGTTIQLLITDQEFYMRADGDSWTTLAGDAAAGALLADRWVLVPTAEEDFAEVAFFADWDTFVNELFSVEGTLSKGDVEEIDGVDTVAIIEDGGGTMWIAIEGDPLPIRGDDGEGDVFDLEWGVDVDITLPEADEVIDLSDVIG